MSQKVRACRLSKFGASNGEDVPATRSTAYVETVSVEKVSAETAIGCSVNAAIESKSCHNQAAKKKPADVAMVGVFVSFGVSPAGV
mgnify:FL=1